MRIPVYSPYLKGNYKKYVNECLDTSWISSKGEFIARFERAFGAYIGNENVTGVSNGTVALHLALSALGVGLGNEVLVPTFTYIASVNTIIQTGATPVFVDSCPDTLQLDVSRLEAALTPRTRAVMAVHLYGYACNLDELTDFCQKHQLFLVEDAAEAFGTRWRGKHVGTFGDVGAFSFFGNKTVTTGEGGMVVTRTPEIFERCRRMKGQGLCPNREYWHDIMGFNYRMTNIQAAIGLSQMELADEILTRKRALAGRYERELKGIPVTFFNPSGPAENSFWMCCAMVRDRSLRDDLRAHLLEAGVETRPFFPPTNQMPHCRSAGSFPVAEDISGRGMNLPSSPCLSDEEVSFVTSQIRAFFDS